MATRAAGLGPPVLLIVDADPGARAETESALVRRFGPDYRVLSAGTPQDGLDVLRRVAGEGTDVALVAADLRLPGMGGVEFLQRARALFTAKPEEFQHASTAGWPRRSVPASGIPRLPGGACWVSGTRQAFLARCCR